MKFGKFRNFRESTQFVEEPVWKKLVVNAHGTSAEIEPPVTRRMFDRCIALGIRITFGVRHSLTY